MSTTVSKGYKGLGMNGFIATWYAKNTQKNMEAYRRSAQLVADKVSEGATILELAPGPGYLSIELAKMGNYHIVGLDISPDIRRNCTGESQRSRCRYRFSPGQRIAHAPG